MHNPIMGNHRVRLAELADATEIAVCVSALGYGTSVSLVAERLATFATSPADAVLVASISGHKSLLGVVGVHLLPLLHAPGLLGRITSLSVATEARGNGVGKALVAAAE
ncbi:MAG: GNAT family N-acetyltransferase, partial [Dokdonella sp.]